MCFAIPLKVASIAKNHLVMEDGRKINFSLAKSVKKGDWLLVHSNLAVDKLTEREAKSMRSIIKEVSSELKD